MNRRICNGLVAAATLVLAACSADPELAVDVRTDLVPGREFDAVTVSLDGTEGAPIEVDTADDFASPHRVAEFRAVAAGRRALRVALTLDGEDVVARRVSLRLDDSVIVLVVLARDCRGVVCPGDGNPAATECLGGRCVDPTCTELDPSTCPPAECVADGDCESDTACADAQCVERVCLELPREPSACAATELCVPGTGCVPAVGESDGGPPDAGSASGTDAGPIDAGACASDRDCPSPEVGAWTDCADFADACDENGTQSQTTTTFACELGACVGAPSTTTRGCARVTESTPCSGGTCCGGACVQTATDEAHCGGCGRVCDPVGASGVCEGGSCGVGVCDPGLADCTAAAGCETSLSSTTSCGACGVACGANETCSAAGACRCGATTGGVGIGPACATALPDAMGACGTSDPARCFVVSCTTDHGNCDGTASNGCEVDLLNDEANCGACGRRCAEGDVCTAGVCRCNGGAGCTGGNVCRTCGCRPPVETVCNQTSGDEDCDGEANCADSDCDGLVCGGGGTQSCVGRSCQCDCPGCVEPC